MAWVAVRRRQLRRRGDGLQEREEFTIEGRGAHRRVAVEDALPPRLDDAGVHRSPVGEHGAVGVVSSVGEDAVGVRPTRRLVSVEVDAAPTNFRPLRNPSFQPGIGAHQTGVGFARSQTLVQEGLILEIGAPALTPIAAHLQPESQVRPRRGLEQLAAGETTIPRPHRTGAGRGVDDGGLQVFQQ